MSAMTIPRSSSMIENLGRSIDKTVRRLTWIVAAFTACALLQLNAAAATATAQVPTIQVLPSNLPLQRDADSAFSNGKVSGPMVVAVILLGALLFYVRFALHRKKRLHRVEAAANHPWSRWWKNSADKTGLHVLSSQRLSPGSYLHVIEWNNKRYLLTQNEHAFALLDQFKASAIDSIASATEQT